MALSKRAKIGLGVALGIGTAVYFMSKDKSGSKKSTGLSSGSTSRPGTVPGVKPGSGGKLPGRATAAEPQEGWQARLVSRGPEAVEACRDDVAVTSYAEAQACVLNAVFPEQRPWGGSTTTHWKPWMFQARQGVRDLLQDQVQAEVGGWGAPGWQFTVWLMLDRSLIACAGNDDLLKCVLKKMYPDETWPPGANASGWKKDAYKYVSGRIGS